jgi:hypothetical protein
MITLPVVFAFIVLAGFVWRAGKLEEFWPLFVGLVVAVTFAWWLSRRIPTFERWLSEGETKPPEVVSKIPKVSPLVYRTRILQPGEAIDYETKPHWHVFVPTMLLLLGGVILTGAKVWISHNQNIAQVLGIAAIIFGFLAGLTGLHAFIRRATTEVVITNRRVIYKTGLVARHTIEMNRDKVQSVEIEQSVFGQILGYGAIIVRGVDGIPQAIRGIGNPQALRGYIVQGLSN